MRLLREYIRQILVEKKPRAKKRVLYHINRHPARPQPKKSYQVDVEETSSGDWVDKRVPGTNIWSRPWLRSDVKSGVFMTDNPVGIRNNHGITGNVYAYRVPEWVIKKSGGVNRFDHGSELLIPEDVWNEAGKEIEFLGKKMDKAEFERQSEKRWSASATGNPSVAPGTEPQMRGWVADDEGFMNVARRQQDKRIVDGLRGTKFLDDAVKLMKPKERARALAAFKAIYHEDTPSEQDQEIIDSLMGET